MFLFLTVSGYFFINHLVRKSYKLFHIKIVYILVVRVRGVT